MMPPAGLVAQPRQAGRRDHQERHLPPCRSPSNMWRTITSGQRETRCPPPHPAPRGSPVQRTTRGQLGSCARVIWRGAGMPWRREWRGLASLPLRARSRCQPQPGHPPRLLAGAPLPGPPRAAQTGHAASRAPRHGRLTARARVGGPLGCPWWVACVRGRVTGCMVTTAAGARREEPRGSPWPGAHGEVDPFPPRHPAPGGRASHAAATEEVSRDYSRQVLRRLGSGGLPYRHVRM
jgi:hypothetical protein